MLLNKLHEKDLDFIVNIVAPEFKNKNQLKKLIIEDIEFRKGLVGSERMFEKIISDPEILVKVSPQLYFEVLLRKAIDDLEKLSYTYEKVSYYKIAIFDVSDVIKLLRDENIVFYLAHLLSSFTRIEKYTLWIKAEKNIWRKISFTDMDVESLKKMAQIIEEEYRFAVYKRIADTCLFILGVFPEHIKDISSSLESGFYEEEGKKFYKLASEHISSETQLTNIFEQLSENFHLAKKPLNFISEQYLSLRKHQIFGVN